MIVLEPDGTLRWYEPNGSEASTADTDTIVLPAEIVLHHEDMIDRVLDFALTVLGLRTVELRVREHAPDEQESAG